jgi:hypothetical protein
MNYFTLKLIQSNNADKLAFLGALNCKEQIENIESIDIAVEVCDVKFNKFNDIVYDLTAKEMEIIIKKVDGQSINKTMTKFDFDKNEDFANLLDDKINGFLVINKNIYIEKSQDQAHFEWIKFNSLLHNAPSLESLYFQIKNDIIIVPENHKPSALFKLLLKNDRINDIFVVEDFITSFFNVKYAELILKYPNINKNLIDLFINHPDINPIILIEYHDITLDFTNLTENTSDIDFISFFYTKVLNNTKYHPEFTTKALSLKNTPQEVLQWLPELFDISFIAKELLGHQNCPSALLESCSSIPSYGSYIFANQNIHQHEKLLKKFINGDLFFTNVSLIIESLLSNSNISNELINQLINNRPIIEEIQGQPLSLIPYNYEVSVKGNNYFKKEINAFLTHKKAGIEAGIELLTEQGVGLGLVEKEATRTLTANDLTTIKESLFENVLNLARSNNEKDLNRTITILQNDKDLLGDVLIFTPKEKTMIINELTTNPSISKDLLKKIL